MTTKIPTSKAKTAFGLLSDVVRLVDAEPARMNMGDWLTTEEGVDSGADEPPPLGFPKCGTVGCIGGWTDVLTEGQSGSAGETLGLTFEQENELFMPPSLVNAKDPQTREHARAVIAHVRQFQGKYRAQLLAKKV